MKKNNIYILLGKYSDKEVFQQLETVRIDSNDNLANTINLENLDQFNIIMTWTLSNKKVITWKVIPNL